MIRQGYTLHIKEKLARVFCGCPCVDSKHIFYTIGFLEGQNLVEERVNKIFWHNSTQRKLSINIKLSTKKLTKSINHRQNHMLVTKRGPIYLRETQENTDTMSSPTCFARANPINAVHMSSIYHSNLSQAYVK